MLTLRTERLLIRPLAVGDAPFVQRLLNEPSFIENIGDRGVRTLDQAQTYLEEGPFSSYRVHGHGLCAVTLRRTGEAIGLCGLLKRDYFEDPDLGYAFLPEYWGLGFALEATRSVVDAARDTRRARRLLATVSPANAASIRLLGKLGFLFESYTRTPPDDSEVALYALHFPMAG